MNVALASRIGSHSDDTSGPDTGDDPSSRWSRMVEAFSRHDLVQLTYGLAEVDASQKPSLCADLAMSTMSRDLIERHFKHGCLAFDPLLRALRAGRLEPMPFDIEAMEVDSEILTEMRTMGLRSGVLFPLPPLAECPVAGLIAASPLTYPQVCDLLDVEGQRLVALAHRFHAQASGELMRRRDAVTPLTGRERDCLQIIARGERLAAAAHQLGLSEATVELHLRNARRKLGARSLPEAVARGLLYRQIEPL